MFFWVVTIFYTLQYLIRGVVSIVFTPFMAEIYFPVDAESASLFLYASAIVELVFALTCIVVMSLRRKMPKRMMKLWLIVLGAVALYEIAWVILTLPTGTQFADLVWPLATIYIFIRGLLRVKHYTPRDPTTAPLVENE